MSKAGYRLTISTENSDNEKSIRFEPTIKLRYRGVSFCFQKEQGHIIPGSMVVTIIGHKYKSEFEGAEKVLGKVSNAVAKFIPKEAVSFDIEQPYKLTINCQEFEFDSVQDIAKLIEAIIEAVAYKQPIGNESKARLMSEISQTLLPKANEPLRRSQSDPRLFSTASNAPSEISNVPVMN